MLEQRSVLGASRLRPGRAHTGFPSHRLLTANPYTSPSRNLRASPLSPRHPPYPMTPSLRSYQKPTTRTFQFHPSNSMPPICAPHLLSRVRAHRLPVFPAPPVFATIASPQRHATITMAKKTPICSCIWQHPPLQPMAETRHMSSRPRLLRKR